MLSFSPESGKVKNQGSAETLYSQHLLVSEIECLPESWVSQFRPLGSTIRPGKKHENHVYQPSSLPVSQQFIAETGEWA